jgi:hypothetical protein
MFEPVSATIGVCLVGYSAVQGYARSGSAVSAEASSARKAANAVVELAHRSYALFGHKTEIIQRLHVLALECSDRSWNGDGAEPVNFLAVHNAEEFLLALTDDLPLPDVSSEPDGSILLDWTASRDRIYSVSIGENLRLAVAWLDGGDRGHEVINFDGKHIPERIRTGIQRIVRNENTSLRAA